MGVVVAVAMVAPGTLSAEPPKIAEKGNSRFIHAPRSGDVVETSSRSDSWHAATYVAARRIL
ncbi:MAG: hypothetical protein ACM3QU_12815 [Verrucomicrobiota bacterium]